MNEQIAIIGFGVTGQATARFLTAAGVRPVIVDTRESVDIPEEFADLEIHCGQRSWPDLPISQAVLSPGLSLANCVVVGARAAGRAAVAGRRKWFPR